VIHGIVIALVIVVGVWVAGVVEKESSKKDPSVVVVDEVAGMLLSLYLIPLSWTGLIVGFFVFRLFDIVKPYPCRRVEKLHGGVGIMADDLIAGVYTNIVLRLASLVWPALLV
jgi:phosphatidylglycerophosphatase A